MAAPTWVAAGTKTEKPSSSGSTSSVAPPAGHASGDLLVITATAYPGVTVSTPAGWTLLGDSGGWGPTDFRSYLFWKLATSSSEPSVTITTSAGAFCDSQMYAFRDVHATTPIDATAVFTGDNTGANIPTPAITTATNDALIVYIAYGTQASTWTTPPAGATERVESSIYIVMFVVATEAKATAGTEAADVYVRASNLSAPARIVAFAIKPAAAAPSSGTFTRIKFGDGLTVTDEGSGVIRVDVT